MRIGVDADSRTAWREAAAALGLAVLLVSAGIASASDAMTAGAMPATDASESDPSKPGKATTGDPEQADLPDATVSSRLARPAVLRGRFVQSKRVAGFSHPLRSDGAFVVVAGRGILWDTQSPFASAMVLTREQVLSTLPDGSRRVIVDGGTPAGAAVTALLVALLSADLDALRHDFDLRPSAHPDGRWRLQLEPKDPRLGERFVRIELLGERHVDEVLIVETGGDETHIRFDGHAEAAAPSADERARLD